VTVQAVLQSLSGTVGLPSEAERERARAGAGSLPSAVLEVQGRERDPAPLPVMAQPAALPGQPQGFRDWHPMDGLQPAGSAAPRPRVLATAEIDESDCV
jgi:hypothetical protein